MSEIANELKIYIEEITQNAAERDRTSGKYERQVKGDGAQKCLRFSSNNATVVTLNNAETMTTQKEKKITKEKFKI